MTFIVLFTRKTIFDNFCHLNYIVALGILAMKHQTASCFTAMTSEIGLDGKSDAYPISEFVESIICPLFVDLTVLHACKLQDDYNHTTELH